MNFVAIMIGGILVNNLVFAKFLGLCPFVGISKRVDTAAGMTMAVLFVMVVASAVTWAIHYLILVPFGLGYLQTVAFILVIAALVQFVEMVMAKTSPGLYQALGIYLPLITTNCAVLGVAILSIRSDYTFIEGVVSGIAGALGWGLAIILFAGVRERWEITPIPKALAGFPAALIGTGLMAIAFFGFQGLFSTLFAK